MIASTEDDGFQIQYHKILLRVINRKPQLFQRWSEIADEFKDKGKEDKAARPKYTIYHVMGAFER